MRKYCMLVVLAMFCVCATVAKKRLIILHTNDVHSCIVGINAGDADTMTAGKGGMIRIAALVKKERKACPDMLLFDTGDFSQGSPYYTLFKGDVESGLLNEMHYDAVAIGNHEFDYGIENMARIFGSADFPVVCSNYDFAGTPLADIVKPYVVLRRNGIKIGVIGLSPELKGLVDETKCVGVKYLDPVAEADRISGMLKNELKCDVVICLSHLGWQEGDCDDVNMITKSRNIDVVLGGHSHSLFDKTQYVNNIDGMSVAVDQNGKSGVYVGKLVLDLEKKAK